MSSQDKEAPGIGVETAKLTPAVPADSAADLANGNSWNTLKPLVRRYWPILAITWSVHFGLGLCASVIGVTLPYLTLNIGETLSRASILFTARSVVVCVTSLAVGLLVSRLRTSRSKLLLLLAGSLINAASVLLMPFARSLAVIVLVQCLFGVGLGTLETVDNMLVIYLFGPVLSRSFSHSLHFCISLGGFLAPLLARPFLIAMGDVAAGGDVCGEANDCSRGGGAVNDSAGANFTVPPVSLEPIKWPYTIVGSLHLLCLCGYALLSLANFQLDKHVDATQPILETDAALSPAVQAAQNNFDSGCRKWSVVSLFVLFYVLHAGQESGFWSYLYSFGTCSRLCLNPDQASLLNTVFFVGYLPSRGLGVLLSGWAQPSAMLLVELAGCLCATTALAVWGDTVPWVAFAGAAAYGFSIAMVFPTGITWLASKLDVTGALSSTWSVGTYIGASTYPLVTGILIGSQAGAIAMMHMAAAAAGAYCLVAAGMMLVARGRGAGSGSAPKNSTVTSR